ncbi:6-bladed beta-propeller [Gracilimonas sp. Q87]|uniref:6-bladed beta-propeller n=1 Tax=Gracilimonas sp. Q87 TaxID=3384766 RepID=UPI003983DAFF
MKRVFKSCIYIFLSIFWITSCNQSEEGIVVKWNNEDYVFPFNYEIEKQEASERTWKDVHLKEIFIVKGLSDSSIFQPLKINVDDSSVYILDATDGYIKQFDFKGNFRRNVGGGLGNGPGEFDQPFDFSMDLHGNIYVIDIGKRSLVSLNNEGGFRWQKLYKHNSPGHVSASDSNIIASVTGVDIDYIFERYDIKGNLKGVYSKLVKNPDDSLDEQIKVFGKPFIGNFEIQEDLTIFIPRYLSQIIFL